MNPNRDALTGLWNWKYVQSILPGILRHNGQVALILADVDWMRVYCNNFGLEEGDYRLQEVAREIEASSGEKPLVFRVGGDEFGVILYEVSLDQAREVAERIRVARTAVLVEEDGVKVEILTLSLGIAHFPMDAQTPEALVEAANVAVRKAKQIGRNCVAAFGGS